MPFPGTFPTAHFASSALGLAVAASSTSLAQTITAPNGIQAGDLLVLTQYAATAGGPAPTAVTPTGFTNISSAADNGNQARGMIDYKIATGSEGGASITGMNGSTDNAKVLVVYRKTPPIVAVTPTDIATEHTTGNPVSQTANASGGAAPLVVIAAFASNGFVDPRTFSPAADGSVVSSNGVEIWQAWKIYNAEPADVTVDMDDEGAFNYLASCYLACA